MEYLGGKQCGDHRAIALDLRSTGVKNRIIGLMHLPVQALLNLYDREYITSGLDALDQIIVFGSSLEEDLAKMGYGSKIRKTFHYVDTHYYHPNEKKINSAEFVVIVMGFLYRNRTILEQIVQKCPNINFELFLGNNMEIHQMFAQYQNVLLQRFMPEEELLGRMQGADVSLSIMDDTIGSNVIGTSLACGLPQIVSDVGSIRDYCSEKNAIFCNDVDSFVESIQTLSENPTLCQEMGFDARKKAETISLEQSINWYRDLFSDSPVKY
jgi:glycosyltransferase involved in cell wall biosynthesis